MKRMPMSLFTCKREPRKDHHHLITIRDLRWQTSLDQIGTDPMNLAGENSFGYLQYHTNTELVGTGWSFANGQGNEYVLNFANH